MWPDDNQCYLGVIRYIDENGAHVVNYDDGDIETLQLKNEDWCLENTINSNLSVLPFIETEASTVLKTMLDSLGHQPFLFHHTQRYHQHLKMNSYQLEETNLKSMYDLYQLLIYRPTRM